MFDHKPITKSLERQILNWSRSSYEISLQKGAVLNTDDDHDVIQAWDEVSAFLEMPQPWFQKSWDLCFIYVWYSIQTFFCNQGRMKTL